MISAILKRFSGSHYRRFIKRATPLVAKINQIEQEYQSLDDAQLCAKTAEFKQRFQQGETLDDLLPEAFAAVKNAARRLCGQQIEYIGTQDVWNMVHFDVQLIGGMALHQNTIAEMATGEGKTLVATLPLYLNALSGRNCQLVTVNEYLAQRDAEWMGHLYRFLGLTVGVIKSQQTPDEKRAMYACDITYGTASEYGFDYLRDNGMATRRSDQVQREHYYCIVDEIDSILVDEARTPLIISGPVQEEREAPFRQFKAGVSNLVQSQNRLCNRLANEARELLEKEDLDDYGPAYEKMVQVKLGMPKNRTFLRLMEDPRNRRPFEKFDLEMNSDFNKKKLYALKEELYYVIDEKQHQADLTDPGRALLQPDDPDSFVLPDLPTLFSEIDKDAELSDEEKLKQKQQEEAEFARKSEAIHCISQLLRAYSLYERDKQYVVHEGKVMIVDENTGRMMPGRRWSDGLHQAVEAKENVNIEKESKTYATITIQNYFRLYEKLAGMTGTAETEAGEFHDIYKLDVMVIPTHKPCIRLDENDIIYKTRREKYNACIERIREAHQIGQPVLVGTASVEASEVLSRMLHRSKIPHNVLNAKYHQQEAEIIARAGQRGAVTIATNMAGRGTDIKLGEGVAELGGLFVLGTERHESRRIDRQLRGRCARQGDPGGSRFVVSLEDDLMRIFANAGPISRILESSFEEGQPLEHPLLNRTIENAQKKVEQQNYTIRKRLLQYDDVLNQQREVIYGIRNDAIHSDDPKEIIFEMVEEELDDRLDAIAPDKSKAPTAEDLDNLVSWVNSHFPCGLKQEALAGKDSPALKEALLQAIRNAYMQKEAVENPDTIKSLERYVVIRSIDRNWQDHLTEMEDLRKAVGLRGYGQRDPLVEYKSEAFTYFQEMIGRVRNDICTGTFRSSTNLETFRSMLAKLQQGARTTGPENAAAGFAGGTPGPAGGGRNIELPKVQPVRRELPKIGRNEMVTIQKGSQTKTLKFKKAEAMLRDDGWVLRDPAHKG